MKIKTSLSISRPNCSDGPKYIKISVTDEKSRVRFLELQIGLAEFAECLTGLSYCESEAEVKFLDKVGKERIYENRTVEMPFRTYDRELAQEWLQQNCQEEGWEVNSYLGSQGSMRSVGEKTVLNYGVTKYV